MRTNVSHCCCTLLSIMFSAMIGTQLIADASAIKPNTFAHNSTVDSSSGLGLLDGSTRQLMCADQQGMCSVSCQNNVQENTCNSTTLHWSCVCKPDAKAPFKDYQLPIPFQLCRRHLSTCMHSCPSIKSLSTTERKSTDSSHEKEKRGIYKDHINRDDNIPQYSTTNLLLRRIVNYRQHTNLHQYEGQQNEIIQNHQQQRPHGHQQQRSHRINRHHASARVRADTENILLIKELTKARDISENNQSNEIQAVSVNDSHKMDAREAENELYWSIMSIGDSREPECVSHCQHQYPCGTPMAPIYHDMTDYLKDGVVVGKDHTTQGSNSAKGIRIRMQERLFVVGSGLIALMLSL